MSENHKITVENVNIPGHVSRVNAEKYTAMKTAILKTLPSTPPGLSFDEALLELPSHLPDTLFPKGATAGWWFKTVQLDLEAKRILKRADTKPLRWYLS